MEFPRTDWVIFEAEDFGTAAVRDPGELGVELLAQARHRPLELSDRRLSVPRSRAQPQRADTNSFRSSGTKAHLSAFAGPSGDQEKHDYLNLAGHAGSGQKQ